MGVAGTGALVTGGAVLAGVAPASAAPPLPVEVPAPRPQGMAISFLEFLPLDSATGYRQVGSEDTYLARTPANAAGAFAAPIRLPVGSTITQVQTWVDTAAGQPVTVRVETTNVAIGTVTVLGSQSVTVPSGSATIPVSAAYGSAPARVVVDLPVGASVRGAWVTYQPMATRHFVPVTPQRRLDTRQTGGIVTPGQIRFVHFIDLPDNVIAVALNVTLAGTISSGWLAAYPAGEYTGGTSTVNWTGPGQTVANSTTVGLSGRAVGITTGGTGSTHVIVDLFGYHLSA
ncbi:hypothetical protein WEI85_05975 [Actinomycetes bacterium KLBMP 9797]